MSDEGDIFMLDMGEGIYIKELAEEMIRAHGLRPHIDIELNYIGLRPGEKLLEELIPTGQTKQKTSHKRIYAISDHYKQNIQELIRKIEELVYCAENLNYNRKKEVDQILARIIPEFQPQTNMSLHNNKISKTSLKLMS